MVTLIRWKIFKSTKSLVKARNNLMNFRSWSKAVEHLANKLGSDYQKQIEDRLFKLEADEVFTIERHR